eukprot:321149_1
MSQLFTKRIGSLVSSISRNSLWRTKQIGLLASSSSILHHNTFRRSVVTQIKEISEFETYLNTSVKLLVIDYKAEWCGPCKRMAPLFDELSEQYDNECDFLSVDCDELPELAAQRGVASLPTFELIRNGYALEQVIGANPTKLEQCIVNNLEQSA